MSLPLEIEGRLPEIRSEVEQEGGELVDVLYRRAGQRGFLTFLVDKEGGISLDDCARINQRLSRYFDRVSEGAEMGVLQGSYFLEVNSPGLDRPLKTPQDFKRAVGQWLRVQVRDARGSTSTVLGKLTALTEQGIELEGNSDSRSLRFEEIFKATRDVAWKK
jgi:ribosome maturation factor RimP